MKLDAGTDLLMEGVRSFHGNFKKMYGQISLRLDENTYLTTGDNKLLSDITKDDIIACDISTGDLGEIFSRMPDVNAFIFGCTQDIVEVSNTVNFFQPALDDLAYIAGRGVKVVADATPESLSTALAGNGLCFVQGIGAFTAFDTIKAATTAILILEKSCEAFVHGKMLGGVKVFTEQVANSLRSSYKNDYLTTNSEQDIAYVEFEEEESELRSKLTGFVRSLADDDLIYGSWGNVSVRAGENEMFITPSAMDYQDITYGDIVSVDINTLEAHDIRVPSMDSKFHADMYKRLPNCNAIMHTHSNACSVFAACEAGFAISNPELKALIGDVKVIPYYLDKQVLSDNIIDTLQDTHAAILAHHGTVFYGPSLETVFEVARGVEQMAQNILSFSGNNDEEE